MHTKYITWAGRETRKVKKLRRTSLVLYASVLAIVGLLAASLTRPASAIVPVVQDVTVFNVDGNTYLNITVFHTPEIVSHYVNTIEVTFESNTTDLTIGVQQLSLDNTFVITYDVGPVTGTPTATVRVHCIVDSWSATRTAMIPEFTSTVLPLVLIALISMVVILARKGKLTINK